MGCFMVVCGGFAMVAVVCGDGIAVSDFFFFFFFHFTLLQTL